MNRAEAISQIEQEARKAASIGVATVGPHRALMAAALATAKAVSDLTQHLKNAAERNDRQLVLTDEILAASNDAVMCAGLALAIMDASNEVSSVSVSDGGVTLN